jgi:DNA-binding NtrC family response regulator
MQGRVLVVDDEKGMRLALTGLLSKEGYQVESADSGEAAVRIIEPGRFHVAITDLSMTGITGMQVLEHARRVDPDLAVIMITAYGSEKIAVQAMKLGAVDYLPKPFDNDEVRMVVRRVMETVRAPARPPPPARAGAERLRVRATRRPQRRHAARVRHRGEGRRHRHHRSSCAVPAAPARSWSPTRCTIAARGAPSRW